MEKRTVCFSGYRNAKMPKYGDENAPEVKQIKERLHQAILDAVNEGYLHYIVGMATGFDTWAGEAVLELRESYEITLECVMPFRGHGDRLRGSERDRYFTLLNGANMAGVLSERFHNGVYHARNQFMIKHSDLLICYYDGKPGGTKYTVALAEKKGIKIINFATDR